MRIFLSLLLAVFICQSFVKDSRAENFTISASINPIYQIVLEIAQDKANVGLIIDPKSSGHDYHFRKKDANLISESDFVFYVSDELEGHFSKLVASYDKKGQSFELVNLEGIKVLKKRGFGKNSEKKSEKNSGGIDPHIWLNPQNGIVIAEFVAQKLSDIDPLNAEKYRGNLKKFVKEVRLVEKKIVSRLSNIKGGFIFYHDGYQYFEDYFNVRPLQIISYHHDSEITVGLMKQIDELAKSKRAKCIFSDLQDERNSAMRLARNYEMKFAILDLIGVKDKGYSEILLGVADGLVGCLG